MAKPISSELILRVNSALVLVALTLALTYAGTQTFAGLILFRRNADELGVGARRSGHRDRRNLRAPVRRDRCRGLPHFKSLSFSRCRGHYLRDVAGIPPSARSSIPKRSLVVCCGGLFAGLPAVALIAIRQDPDYGFHAILYLFLVVWSADTGAFFTGRLIGGPKLAPKISPNKTWSGFVGARFSPASRACFLPHGSDTHQFPRSQRLAYCLRSSRREAILANFSSALFRGEKSSGLIPGHGGVLDRLDGLVFAAIGAGLIAAVAGPSKPGHALLVWH